MEGAGRDANPLSGYRIGKTLGIGSFGKVKIAEHILTGHKVAIKILNRRKIRSMEMEEKVKREIKILRLFMHPHIIRLYEVIDTPADIYVVMEYVKSGELFDYIVEKGRLHEEEARRFFQQVISGRLYAGSEVDVWSCGVILYALLCGTLPFDDENIPNLFKKIKGGIYTLPSHLSPSARDLIPRMLVVDPMKRITIREIREHVWFKIRLPRYLAVPPPGTAQQVKKLDEETLNDVIKMGFDKNLLIESLQNRLQNEATVAYYLLLDNRLRTTSGYLGAEFQESMDSSFSQVIAETPTSATVLRQHFAAERKWALGLQSRAHPREIITEVLKALRELNVYWKKIGYYNMKCRWSPGCLESMMHNNDGFGVESAIIETDDLIQKSTPTVKFEIQLYKTRDEKYLLDLQRRRAVDSPREIHRRTPRLRRSPLALWVDGCTGRQKRYAYGKGGFMGTSNPGRGTTAGAGVTRGRRWRGRRVDGGGRGIEGECGWRRPGGVARRPYIKAGARGSQASPLGTWTQDADVDGVAHAPWGLGILLAGRCMGRGV
ncbi:SNF1-related protein kinase catalytic subunit alpha KIN10-like [Panicum miliaceum]|uniref:non-specific serine/threonine protein kinase n=1 Tax=Panicum miliaceum TaxID=4540 RepID=A0A3L6T3L9_PANMI|nr:SNF1-related protein kinase catalytic subunit alpha KIN10-like [Panicum miliaceum]